MPKLNCWELMKCGQGPSDEVASAKLCPAATDDRGHGINGGECCGRLCWSVEGTRCGGRLQGSSEEKRAACEKCDFFRLVAREEGISFQLRVYEHSQAW